MDRDDLKGRMEALEERLRWQKRAIAGLVVVVLFSASPALTRASKWFDRILPAKLTSLSLQQVTDRGEVRFDDLSSVGAELPLPETGYGELSKIAPEQTLSAGDTLRVGAVHIINTNGALVAAIGSSQSGNGVLEVRNSSGDVVSVVGVDPRGHGTMGVLNSSGRVTAAKGADRLNRPTELSTSRAQRVRRPHSPLTMPGMVRSVCSTWKKGWFPDSVSTAMATAPCVS